MNRVHDQFLIRFLYLFSYISKIELNYSIEEDEMQNDFDLSKYDLSLNILERILD